MKKMTLSVLLITIFLLAYLLGTQGAAQADGAIPWNWYISRASALAAFLLLYASIFFGLAIRMPFLKKIISPARAFDMHCWISVQVLLLALVHGVALIGDKFIQFAPRDIFVPFASTYETDLVAFGVLSFYMLAVLIVTSYWKKFLPQAFWRATHSLNVGLYVIAVIHALYLGTDLKIVLVRDIFIGANVVLAMLFAYNMIDRIFSSIRKIKMSENN